MATPSYNELEVRCKYGFLEDPEAIDNLQDTKIKTANNETSDQPEHILLTMPPEVPYVIFTENYTTIYQVVIQSLSEDFIFGELTVEWIDMLTGDANIGYVLGGESIMISNPDPAFDIWIEYENGQTNGGKIHVAFWGTRGRYHPPI